MGCPILKLFNGTKAWSWHWPLWPWPWFPTSVVTLTLIPDSKVTVVYLDIEFGDLDFWTWLWCPLPWSRPWHDIWRCQGNWDQVHFFVTKINNVGQQHRLWLWFLNWVTLTREVTPLKNVLVAVKKRTQLTTTTVERIGYKAIFEYYCHKYALPHKMFSCQMNTAPLS